MIIETERLLIREWQDTDLTAYAGFMADSHVRRFFPSQLTTEQAQALIERQRAMLANTGIAFLPIERKSDGAVIGHAGLLPINMPLRGDPPFEIGWLLGKDYWGQGYAPEAASAWLTFAFDTIKASEIVAFTAQLNLPSQRVMEKLGMARDHAGDFDHPNVPQGNPLRPHVLYRISPAAPR